MIAAASDHELIGRFLDGPSDAESERELARRIAADPQLGRLLRRHLLISEAAEQDLLPERTATAFADAWQVRVGAEADAAVFTARTMLRIVAERDQRRSIIAMASVRSAALAAAALLLIAIGWAGAQVFETGKRWLQDATEVRLDDPALAERGRLYRQLTEAQP